MDLSHAILGHRKSVVAASSILAVLSIFFTMTVPVNYNMVDYLPSTANSTVAIGIMQEEFGGELPNARVMVEDVSVQEALDYKEKLMATPGITAVVWLDDMVGLDTLNTTPLEFLDASLTDDYYKDRNALYSVSIASAEEAETLTSIYNLIGENNAVSGDAVNTALTQTASVSEVVNAMAILLPIIIIILIFSTTSWLEPLLYLLTIGVAVLINMGTNVIFGEISFVTQTVSPILQLAVSLDYAIFLLHSFNDLRASHEPREAMRLAMKRALPSVAASAGTTVIGFLALAFMRFGIGADLGLNLVKGILLSFISVMVFLPALTLLCGKLIDKTKHRALIPSIKGSGILKIKTPFLILAVIIVLPCFLAQSNTEFAYGTSGVAATPRATRDSAVIEEQFGKENALVLLVPRESAGKESELCDALSDIPHITGLLSYVTAVGASIPTEYVPQETVEQFYSSNYARIVLYTDISEEGEEAFMTVEAVLDTAAEYYETYYVAGQSATLYDMKNVVGADTGLVNLIAIIGILIVLLLTFKSISIPIILLFTIETAIWINLAIPYFTGQPIVFIGYLIISTVQLGATVDYAILLTNRYFAAREDKPKNEAMKTAMGENLISILVSAVILATAGFTLALTSSNPIISELGTLLGRGTVLSFIMVAFVLPALLLLFDKVIQKTTLKCNFYNSKISNEEHMQ